MGILEFFNKHKGVRRLALLWVICLVTYMIVVKINFDTINTAGGVIASAVIGLVGTMVHFYSVGRNDESTRTSDSNDSTSL